MPPTSSINNIPRSYTIAHTESSLAWGGQEIRIMTELTGMRDRGHRMLLAAPQESQILARAIAAGFETLALDGSKWALPTNAGRLAHWFGKHQVDVVNPHSSRDGWSAGIAARLAAVPLVIRSRHFDVPLAAKVFSRLVYTRLADHLITTSPKVSADFRRVFQLPEEQVSTISTGVDTERFHPKGPPSPLTVPQGQAAWPLIGMVAVLRHAKGHVLLIRAARVLREQGLPLRLLFVGDGPSKAPIDREVEACKLTDAVHFTGHRDDIPEILRALDCVALPSLHECVPQTALQAMACGVPVIGSDAGGIPAVIRHGETGRIFARNNVEALAECLADVFRQSDTTRRLSKQARAYVEEQHSVERMLDRLEALYARRIPTLN